MARISSRASPEVKGGLSVDAHLLPHPLGAQPGPPVPCPGPQEAVAERDGRLQEYLRRISAADASPDFSPLVRRRPKGSSEGFSPGNVPERIGEPKSKERSNSLSSALASLTRRSGTECGGHTPLIPYLGLDGRTPDSEVFARFHEWQCHAWNRANMPYGRRRRRWTRTTARSGQTPGGNPLPPPGGEGKGASRRNLICSD